VAGSALQALSSTASGLKRQAEGVLEVMTAELAEKCVNVVKQLKVRLDGGFRGVDCFGQAAWIHGRMANLWLMSYKL